MVLRRTDPGALPSDVRTAWTRLGEPASLGAVVPLIYLPFGLAGPLFIDTTRLGGDPFSWFIVGLIGWAALFAVFALGRVVVSPLQRARPVAALGVILVSVAARAVALAVSAYALGLTANPEFTYRFNSALFTQSAFIITCAIVVSSYAHHRTLAADLLAQRDRLSRIGNESRARLEELQSSIALQVRRIVDPVIVQLDEVSTRTDGSHAHLHDGIRRIVDEELRPLSHRIAETASIPVAEYPATPGARPLLIPLPTQVSVGRLLRPVPTGLLAVLLAASQAIRALGVGGGLAFVLALSGSLFAVVLITQKLLCRLVVPAWLGVCAAAFIVAVEFLVVIQLWEFLPLTIPPHLQWAALYSGALVGGLLSIDYLVNEQRAATENHLRESVRELQEQSSILRQHEFMAGKQLSYIVHGSVQTALNAAAMRLALSTQPDASLVAAIRTDIDESLEKLDASSSAYVLLVQTLTDISDLWEGTAQFTWTLDHRTVRALAESPPTAASVGEIVNECVSNAICHGRATQIQAKVQASENVIEVVIEDDGCGPSTASGDGLGSRMMNDVCVRWERAGTDSGTVVTAVLATQKALEVP